MTANRIDICIALYFQKFRVDDWPEPVAILASDVSGALGSSFTHFSLDYIGDRELLSKEKVYRLLDRNISKLRKVLGSRRLKNLYCYRSSDTDVIHNSELIVAVDVDDDRQPYGRCYIEFPQQWVTSTNTSEIIYLLLTKADALFDIKYGLMTAMSPAKLPAMYFADGYVSNLDRTEILDLAIWLRHKTDFTNKIRGLYPGNLLSSGHLDAVGNVNHFIEQTEGILGNEHVRTLPSGKLFFDLPDDKERVTKLRELLEIHGLLMRADGTEQIPTLYYMVR